MFQQRDGDARHRPARSVRFLFGRSFRRGEGFETFVRYRPSAFDREAVGAGSKARLGSLDGGELFAEVVRQTLIELVLVQLGGQIGRVRLVRRLAGVLVPEPRERPLDSLALGGQ